MYTLGSGSVSEGQSFNGTVMHAFADEGRMLFVSEDFKGGIWEL